MATPNADELYRQYHGRILAYVRSKTGGIPDAEDLTSEIFMKVISALNAYDPEKASLSTWIYTIARNRVTDFYRARRVETVPIDDDFDIPDTQDDDTALDMLDTALDALPERQREIVILRYYFDMPHKEIARRMNISYTNARQLCHVAVGALKRELCGGEKTQ